MTRIHLINDGTQVEQYLADRMSIYTIRASLRLSVDPKQIMQNMWIAWQGKYMICPA